MEIWKKLLVGVFSEHSLLISNGLLRCKQTYCNNAYLLLKHVAADEWRRKLRHDVYIVGFVVCF